MACVMMWWSISSIFVVGRSCLSVSGFCSRAMSTERRMVMLWLCSCVGSSFSKYS